MQARQMALARIIVASRGMGIVTRRTCKRVAALIALAFSQISDLISNVVILGKLTIHPTVVILQWFTRTITQRRSTLLNRIGVTLSTEIDLPFPRQIRRPDNCVGCRCLGMLPMEFNMLTPRTVTTLEGHTR